MTTPGRPFAVGSPTLRPARRRLVAPPPCTDLPPGYFERLLAERRDPVRPGRLNRVWQWFRKLLQHAAPSRFRR